MSTSIEKTLSPTKTPTADTAPETPAPEAPETGKRSTSASSGDKKPTGTHIWAAKDPWSGKPGAADKDSKPTKKTTKRPRSSKGEKSEKTEKAP